MNCCCSLPVLLCKYCSVLETATGLLSPNKEFTEEDILLIEAEILGP